MYKVLIIDDDFPVRMFLKGIINWADYGCEVVGEAIDGEEGLEKIEKLKPEIILLDIGMPVMNGIELIKKVNEMNYYCKIIVLSLHDEFQYVKDALQLGAIEYILKNMLTKESLLNVIEGAKAQIEKELREKNEYRNMELMANKGMVMEKRKFVSELIQGKIKDRIQVWESIEKLKVQISYVSNIVIVLKTDLIFADRLQENAPSKETSSYSVMDICQDILNDFSSGEIIQVKDNIFAVVYGISKERSGDEVLSDAFKISDRIRSSINRYLNIDMTMGISDINDNVTALNLNYIQGLKALKLEFYNGKNKIFYYRDAARFINKEIKLSKDEEKHIIDLLKKASLEELSSIIDKYFINFRAELYDPERVYSFCRDLLILLNMFKKQYGISEEEASIEDIQNTSTVEGVKDLMKELIKSVAASVNDMKVADVLNENIKKAMYFINNNYMKEIGLNDVAEHVHMNMSYFSTLFKKETGMSYLEYLKNLRIKKAKELLGTTNKKINEVSKAVGIVNQKNFSKLFMEIEGMTPMEYRRSIF